MSPWSSASRLLTLTWPLLAVVACMLLLALLGMSALSAVRAYVGGEGLYSKAQKEGVIQLLRYADSSDESAWLRYREALAINQGDRDARLALLRPQPDLEAARRGFLAGGNHPDDISGLVFLFRWLRFDPDVARAIAIWTEGDALIEQLDAEAQAMRAALLARGAGAAQVERRIESILELNDRLRRLEDEFSSTLGTAARRTFALVAAGVALLSLLLVTASLVATRRMLQRMRSYEDDLSFMNDNVPAMVAIYGTDLQLRRCNQAYAQAFGLDPAQAAGLPLGRVVGAEYARSIEPHFQAAAAGRIVDYERRLALPGGRVADIEVTLIPQPGRDGRVAQIYALMHDVTERGRAASALRVAEARKAAVLDVALDCVITIDRASRIIEFNRAAEATFGYAREQVLGRDLSELIIPPRLREPHRHGMARYLASGEAAVLGRRVELQAMRADGVEIPVELSITPVEVEGNLTFTAYLRDISERRRHEQALAQQATRQSIVARFGQIALAHTDPATLMREAVAEIATGLAVPHCSIYEVAADGSGLLLRARAGGRGEPEFGATAAADGSTVAGYCLETRRAVVVHDVRTDVRFPRRPADLQEGYASAVAVPILGADGAYGALCVQSDQPREYPAEDLSFLETIAHVLAVAVNRHRSERQLAYLAQFDPLTGLPNRNLFRDRLVHAISRAHRGGRRVALLFVDLDRFKDINDTLGEATGDRVLREVAGRLQGCLREGDTLARLSGDEFTVIVEELGSADQARTVAQKLCLAFTPPVVVEGRELRVTPSIGVALFPTDGTDAERLLQHADIAMYHAKRDGGGGFRFYAPDMGTAVNERRTLESRLRLALELGQFVLHYQPIVDLRNGAVAGAEALIRWQHPEEGLVPPARFIGVAEQTGIIGPIGEWVLHEACTQMQRCRDDGLPPVPIAVNLSARQVRTSSLVDSVRSALGESRLDPALLKLEITESLLMENPAASGVLLEAVNGLGVRLSLDDFGTGYSSLSYLKHFPLDVLKIDRSFVEDVPHGADDAAIVRATIGLAHSLGMEVVAEGVETEEQAAFLRSLGCEYAQGYLFSRPVEAARFTELLQSGRRFAAAA